MLSTFKFRRLRGQMGLLSLALLEAGTVLYITREAPHDDPWHFIGSYFVTFAVYLLAVRKLLANPSTSSLPLIYGTAILLRLAALPMAPTLSDDVYRYLWEGKVGLAGLSPYRFAPDSIHLNFLADSIRDRVNHPEISSIYPPLAQWLFQGIARSTYTPLACKVAFAAFDLLTVLAVAALLARRGLHPALILLYAWNPLPVLEFAGTGHLDSAAIAALLAALAIGDDTDARAAAASLLLAVSTLLKVFAVALVPVAILDTYRTHGPRRAALSAAIFTGAVSLLYLPYLDDGTALLEGTGQYSRRWSFNSSVFAIARAAVGEPRARVLMIALFALIVLMLTMRRVEPVRAAFIQTGAFFLLSPTAHPWYLCWVLPFLPLFPATPWLLLSGTVALSYSVFAGAGGWLELPWIPWLEYLPVYLLLGWTVARQVAHRGWGQACG